MTQALYPLKFEPLYQRRVWGGRALEQLGKHLPGGADDPIGESWEIADLLRTATGEPARSIAANGPLAGQRIDQLIKHFTARLLGERLASRGIGPGFPLLIKYLDARQNLSVQVHPDSAYVAQHPGTHLKSEAWYVVDARPGAVIYKGLKPGVTPQQFRKAVADGSVEPLLNAIAVRVGDCHYLPSGTCHALGAGVTVAEVQTPSDTTFRVYDWGRTGRELHVEQAMQCIHFGAPDTNRHEQHRRSHQGPVTVDLLVQCPHFTIEQRTASRCTLELSGGEPVIWMVLDGAGRITCRVAGAEETSLSLGQTVLLPADMRDPFLHIDSHLEWLEIRIG